MTYAIRAVKLFVFLAGIAWATYATCGFMIMARLFSDAGQDSPSLVSTLASVQAYALVFGPAAVALTLLLSRWPENRLEGRDRAK